MSDQTTSMKFPCEFPLKVMGPNTEAFLSIVLAVFDKHVKPSGYTVSRRLSSADKYLSLTVTFTAQSKEQLEAIYQELNDHKLVLMTL